MKAKEARKIALKNIASNNKEKEMRRNKLVDDILINKIPILAKEGKLCYKFYIYDEKHNWDYIYSKSQIVEPLFSKFDRDIIVYNIKKEDYKVDIFQEIEERGIVGGIRWRIEVSW